MFDKGLPLSEQESEPSWCEALGNIGSNLCAGTVAFTVPRRNPATTCFIYTFSISWRFFQHCDDINRTRQEEGTHQWEPYHTVSDIIKNIGDERATDSINDIPEEVSLREGVHSVAPLSAGGSIDHRPDISGIQDPQVANMVVVVVLAATGRLNMQIVMMGWVALVAFTQVAQNIGNAPSTINWSATAPTGITITPSSGSFTVPVGGSGNQSFTIAASANLQEGYYSVPFSVKTSNHAKLPPLSMLVVVANPGSLLPFFNNIGISNDSNPSNADFDGSGYSYSAQQLASDGYTPGATVTVNGISYTWPNVPVATFDNIAVNGQTIQTPNAKTGATQLTFLGSATNGPSVGNMTITYTDGTSVTAQLGFTDWTINAGGGSIMYNNVIAAKTSYRNSSGGTPDPTATYVFATAPVQLDSTKQVASITLPSSVNQGTLHIFALTIS